MTQLQIINLALSHLGQNPITQTELTADTSPSAIAANDYWEPCQDEVLGEAAWSFATVTQSLSAIETLEDVEWSYMYDYPTLAVSSIWNVFNEGTPTTKGKQEFEVKYVPSESNKVIFSNLEDAIAEYTYQVTDPLIWSHKFCMAMSYLLAARMAVPLAADTDKALKILGIYAPILDEAKRLDASSKIKKPPQSSSYVNARG